MNYNVLIINRLNHSEMVSHDILAVRFPVRIRMVQPHIFKKPFFMIPKNYRDSSIDKLREKFSSEDSIKKRYVIINQYLSKRIRQFENMMEDEKITMYYDMGELVVELLQDLELAKEQIQSTYNYVFEK